MTDPALLLPVQSLLIHIGPHKTGTTAVQGAFHLARPKLAEFGVSYAGLGRRPARAVYALTGRSPRIGEPSPSQKQWDRLVGEINDDPQPRVVLSSESFSDGDETIPGILAETFTKRKPHVVVTLRPLAQILPSQWQQYVQNGLRATYPRWLQWIFDEPERPISEKFWRRHDHGALVKRWADAFGPENCTIVVNDGADRGMLLRTFEDFCGLPEGLLVPMDSRQNRSLTYGEVELHRRLNVAFHDNGWGEIEYAKLLRHGMVLNLQRNYQPSPKVPRIVTPRWAVERAAETGARSAATIAGLGTRVVGDLDSIGQALDEDLIAGEQVKPPPSLPMRAVTQAAIGIIIGTQQKAPIEIVLARTQRKRITNKIRRVLRRALRRSTDPATTEGTEDFDWEEE